MMTRYFLILMLVTASAFGADADKVEQRRQEVLTYLDLSRPEYEVTRQRFATMLRTFVPESEKTWSDDSLLHKYQDRLEAVRNGELNLGFAFPRGRAIPSLEEAKHEYSTFLKDVSKTIGNLHRLADGAPQTATFSVFGSGATFYSSNPDKEGPANLTANKFFASNEPSDDPKKQGDIDLSVKEGQKVIEAFGLGTSKRLGVTAWYHVKVGSQELQDRAARATDSSEQLLLLRRAAALNDLVQLIEATGRKIGRPVTVAFQPESYLGEVGIENQYQGLGEVVVLKRRGIPPTTVATPHPVVAKGCFGKFAVL